MPVIREGKIDSLTEAGMNAFEKEITKFERLAKKITELEERLEKDKKNKIRGSIFEGNKQEAMDEAYDQVYDHIKEFMPHKWKRLWEPREKSGAVWDAYPEPPPGDRYDRVGAPAYPIGTKKGGIAGRYRGTALPMRQQNRLEKQKEAGLYGGRLMDSEGAKGKLGRKKVRPEYDLSKVTFQESLMMGLLGKKVKRRKEVSKDSLVGGRVGR